MLSSCNAAVKNSAQVSGWSNNIAYAIEGFVQKTMSVDSLQKTVNEQPYSIQKIDGTVKTAQGAARTAMIFNSKDQFVKQIVSVVRRTQSGSAPDETGVDESTLASDTRFTKPVSKQASSYKVSPCFTSTMFLLYTNVFLSSFARLDRRLPGLQLCAHLLMYLLSTQCSNSTTKETLIHLLQIPASDSSSLSQAAAGPVLSLASALLTNLVVM
jgi:hypothetical protein